MTTNAFALLFLPACLAVPAGLAVGVLAELMIERIGAVFAPSTAVATDARPACGGLDARPKTRRAIDEDRTPEDRARLRGLPAPAADAAEDRRELAWFGLCGGPDAPARRDEMAFLNTRRPVADAPWM